MKQSKVASAPPPPPSAPKASGPRYRYFSTTPTTVTLRMRDLQVPEKARAAGYNSEQFVDLPCADILGGPAPKIRLARLAELAPDCVTAKDLPDEGVKVCSARLALAFVVTEGREVLAEPPAPEPPPAPAPVAMEEFAPPSLGTKTPVSPGKISEPNPAGKKSETIPAVKTSEPAAKLSEPAGKPPAKLSESAPKPAESAAKIPEPSVKEDKKPALKPEKPPAPANADKAPQPPASPASSAPAASAPAPAIPPVKSETPKPASPQIAPAGEDRTAKTPEPEPPAPAPIPPAKKPFSLFPMFRRKEATDSKPSIMVPRGRIEIPQPKRPHPPSSTAPEPTAAPAPEPPLKEFKPSGPKPSIPKPRFEPTRSFEPKITPVSPAPAAQPPEKPAETPSAPATPPTPSPEPPKATAMPELPVLTPKGPPRLIERMRAAEAATKKASVPAPAPAPEGKSETQPLTKTAPEAKSDSDLKSEPKLETPPAPSKSEPVGPVPTPPVTAKPEPAAPVIPPIAAKVEPVAPAIESPAPAVKPPAPETPAPQPPAPAAKEAPKNVPVKIDMPPPVPAATAPAVLVQTEHIPQKDVPPEIAEQDSLQAIFHTEEQLSVDRVLELCGNLPGIHSCMLSHGSNVIAAHNTPDSVDIVSLSAHALEMLKAMRASSAKMGIGAVPAVTIHSEKGPITFFHQDDLCLLVLHKDRGFVPGVREKLQFVMDELSKAKLPLRLGDGPGKKLLGK